MINIITLLKEILIGIDIGLFIYILFLYIRIKKVEVQEKIDNLLADSIPDGELKGRLLNARKRVVQDLGERYKPLSVMLRQELKYLSLFLLIYNIIIAIMYLLS